MADPRVSGVKTRVSEEVQEEKEHFSQLFALHLVLELISEVVLEFQLNLMESPQSNQVLKDLAHRNSTQRIFKIIQIIS